MSNEEGLPIQYYNLNGACRIEFGGRLIPHLHLNRESCLKLIDILLQHVNTTRTEEKPIAPVIDLRLVKRDPEN